MIPVARIVTISPEKEIVNMAENNAASQTQQDQNPEDHFASEWITNLLAVLDNGLAEETRALLLRGCAASHYANANMDAVVSQYTGNLAGFLQFLSEKWQWKVAYDPAAQTITADENKPDCVCPLVQKAPGKVSATLCHCSEGFAQRMFSAVIEKPVKARVVRSVLRGDKSCVYSIQVL
jgi:hypothetical protein